MNRRDFMVHGTVAAGLGVAAMTIAGDRSFFGLAPYRVIIDARFPESCEFGASAGRMGCEIRPIHGDVTALWFNELQPHWARRKEAIVGMTTAHSLLCLEQLAWEQWMRVAARVEHRSQPDGTIRHRLLMPASALAETRSALEGNGHWAERVAAALVKRPGADPGGRPMQSVFITRPARALSRISLVSWAIAPRSGADADPRIRDIIKTTEASL